MAAPVSKPDTWARQPTATHNALTYFDGFAPARLFEFNPIAINPHGFYYKIKTRKFRLGAFVVSPSQSVWWLLYSRLRWNAKRIWCHSDRPTSESNGSRQPFSPASIGLCSSPVDPRVASPLFMHARDQRRLLYFILLVYTPLDSSLAPYPHRMDDVRWMQSHKLRWVATKTIRKRPKNINVSSVTERDMLCCVVGGW